MMERLFHSLTPLCEKHFCPKADLRRGTAKSVLVLRSSLLHDSNSLMNISARQVGASSLTDLYTIDQRKAGLLLRDQEWVGKPLFP